MEKQKHIKLLVIGRTGAGKITFINMVANQFYKRKYVDERVIAITQNASLKTMDGGEIPINLKCTIDQFKNKQTDALGGNSPSGSQTQGCNLYTFQDPNEPLILTNPKPQTPKPKLQTPNPFEIVKN
jgi:GTPase SAR1 family protein